MVTGNIKFGLHPALIPALVSRRTREDGGTSSWGVSHEELQDQRAGRGGGSADERGGERIAEKIQKRRTGLIEMEEHVACLVTRNLFILTLLSSLSPLALKEKKHSVSCY